MNVRFVSPDLAWTESMKKTVQSKIVDPLSRKLKKSDFEMSVHLEIGWTRTPNLAPRFELWVVMQNFGGRGNAVVRRAGSNFPALAEEVSKAIFEKLAATTARPTSLFHFP